MLCLFVTATVSASQTATKPYAQVIVDEMVLRNPGLAMLSIAISDAATTSTKVIASTDTSAVGMTDTDGSSGTMANIANQRCKAVVPLQDVGGAAIGSFEAELKGAGASTKAACLEQATGLRNDLAQVIPSREVLLDPFIVSSSAGDSLAQKLTIDTLGKYPDLLILAMHVTAPGDTVNRVVAINQPKFLGGVSNEVDHDVSKSGKMVVQMIPKTHRMEVHMPLRARDGSLVGCVVTVYLWKNETEAPELIRRSMSIRDELQPRVPSLPALLGQGE